MSAPAPETTDTSRVSSVRLGVARTRLELLQFFRERDNVVFTFAFPIALLLIFGSVFSGDLGAGVSFTQYFAAGMIAAGVAMSSFQTLSISIALERDDGTLKRLRGTPMPPVAYFLGKVGLVLVTSVAQTVILIAVGAAVLGLDLPGSWQLWARFLVVFVVGAAAGTVLGIAFSSVPGSGRSAVAVVIPVVTVLMFISGVYFVFSDLPSWMQSIASVFPLKWMAQGMRSVFLPEEFAAMEPSGSWQFTQGLVVLGLWTVVGLLLALRSFRWLRRDAG
ncbi:MAG: ABC transporter [Micrococcales bacterium]|nr:MAG: ABC transporter [Micrococcales bacterium]PIE27624.1 MAG: ABC transporter [Micrococcales bacterium]